MEDSKAPKVFIEPDQFYTKDLVDPVMRSCIGDYTYGNPQISGLNPNFLKIGKFCSIAGAVKILLGAGHNYENFSSYPFDNIRHNGHLVWETTKTKPGGRGNKTGVVIGNDVWIGCRVTILPGVTIGDGAVIGACTVVSKNVDPYAVVVGNPMRQIRSRFDLPTCRKLLEMKWWDWPREKLLEALPYLSDVKKFIKLYG